MVDVPMTVERQPNKLVISTPDLDQGVDEGVWTAFRLDSGRILLSSKESGSSPEKSLGIAKCTIDVLHDMLLGLNHRKWSGVLSIDTGFGQKRLFFNRGELTFAGSSLIDDRLGEVIYREAMITLDQLTSSAVQVDRSTKFGQVLLRDKIFTNTDLWNALKNQVREIFRSIFLINEIYVEITSGTPPTEVTFDEGTETLIENAFSAGLQFRGFFKRLRRDAKISVIEGERVNSLPPGTFLADIIQLARKHPTVGELLETSKLTDINTLWVLHKMSCLGYLDFNGLQESQSSEVSKIFNSVRHKIDHLSTLSDVVLKAFESTKIMFPASELQKFAWSLNDGNLPAIYTDDRGQLGIDCANNIYSQCIAGHTRTRYFEVRLDSLYRYMLQVAGDMLPFEAYKQIKSQFAGK